MPIYEYECGACGFRHEALQKINDPLLTDCPKCATPALKRLVSAVRFRLSGSGWYETDFKSDNKRNLVTGDSQEKSEPKDGKKSDVKNGSGKPAPEGKNPVSSSSKSSKPSVSSAKEK